jgi:D-aminopeptidase
MKIGTLVTSSGVQGIIVPCDDEARLPGMVSMVMLDGGSVLSAYAEDFVAAPVPEAAHKIVILADMEGTTGVPPSWSSVTPPSAGEDPSEGYAASCRNMTLDVLATVAGARAGGARHIVVADFHWNNGNLDEAALIEADAKLVRGSMAGIAEFADADAVMIVGAHARAGTTMAFLPHTYAKWIGELRIDEVVVGEIGMLARLAAHQGVSVIAVSGDAAACQEAGGELQCRVAATKTMAANGEPFYESRLSATSAITRAAYEAVRELASGRVFNLPESSPGSFEVATGALAHRIDAGDILSSYRKFQAFAEQA